MQVKKNKTILAVALLALLCFAQAAWAQFRVEVSGVGLTQTPIALPAFRSEDLVSQKIASIVQADLERTGQFKAVEPIAGVALDEATRPVFSQWRSRKTDALLTGSVSALADGRFEVRFRLWDVVKAQDLGGKSFAVVASDLRFVAHRTADYVYEKLTGEKGVFSSRIAYVTKNGQRYQLWVADADGENPQVALSSSEPLISPSWSSSGTQLAYVSFESRKAVIYAHDLVTGKRRAVANFKGSNSAPTWSPDGKFMVATLSREGGSQLFALDPSGGSEPKRLLQSQSIDTEPVMAADGKYLYFVSDRGGAPQIYRVAMNGAQVAGEPERVTFSGSFNISPAISLDGKSLAYISRVGGAFRLFLMDLNSSTTQALTETDADESPAFAPNGRLIIYATQIQGREALMTTTLDGKVKAKLNASQGDIREPDWGPYQK
jgi:TolB protein